jgi:hypothetical protein
MRWAKRIILVVVILVGTAIAALIAFFVIWNEQCKNEIAKSYQPFDA